MDWNSRYQETPDYVFGKDPARFLLEVKAFLPKGGLALDVACGEGRNAVFLSKLGFRVLAVDLSKAGLLKALRLAKGSNTQIQTAQADLSKAAFRPSCLDLVVCINFLERRLLSYLMEALKPKGRLFMETYTKGQIKYGFGPSNVEHLLKNGELLSLLSAFRVLFYQEYDNETSGAKAGIVIEKG
jgi:SAM-dependent methyltransferase